MHWNQAAFSPVQGDLTLVLLKICIKKKKKVELCGGGVSCFICLRLFSLSRTVATGLSQNSGELYRIYMKIATQLVSSRRNASACCDHQVHVQGTLHYSRSPRLPDPCDPAWGWGGRWVTRRCSMVACFFLLQSCCSTSKKCTVQFSTLESSRQLCAPFYWSTNLTVH